MNIKYIFNIFKIHFIIIYKRSVRWFDGDLPVKPSSTALTIVIHQCIDTDRSIDRSIDLKKYAYKEIMCIYVYM